MKAVVDQIDLGECPVDILGRAASAAQDAVEQMEQGFFEDRNFDQLRELLSFGSINGLPTP